MTGRHTLTFRGENGAIPAGFGLCTKCGALLQMEAWLDGECSEQTIYRQEEEDEDHAVV